VVDRIAAEVNGEIILQSEISERLFQMKSSGAAPHESDAKVEQSILNSMIEEKLIIQYGKDKKIKIPEKDITNRIDQTRWGLGMDMDQFKTFLGKQGFSFDTYKKMLADQIMVQTVLSREVRSQVQIEPKTAREYYDTHKKEFIIPGMVKARHILRIVPRGASAGEEKEVLRKINEIRAELVDGLKFSAAAKVYSQGPSARKGGELGYVKPGQMVPEFDKIVFSLKPGEISEPVRTRFGYHLILVEDRKPPELPPFEKVKGQVLNRMYDNLVKEVRSEWLSTLKREAFIDKKETAK